LTAAVSGPPQQIAAVGAAERAVSAMDGTADYCEIPGGSDFPGMIVRFVATDGGEATLSRDFPLPDFGEALFTGVESLPDAGARVEAGDTIKLHALGMLMDPALGIKVLYLYAGDELIEAVGNKSGSDQPISCDLRRLFAEMVSEYRVPSDPPPVIRICAKAAGFDGTEAEDCIEFYTGEVWKGTIGGEATILGCESPMFSGDFTLVVAGDGSVTGDAHVTTSAYTCDNGASIPPVTLDYPISGKKIGDRFELDINGGRVDLDPVGPGQVEGEFTQPFVRETFSATCQSC
jgi:hypothetical protein